MLVTKPRYQTIEGVEEKYSGSLVLLVRCTGTVDEPTGGEVVLASEEVQDFLFKGSAFVSSDKDYGLVVARSFLYYYHDLDDFLNMDEPVYIPSDSELYPQLP